MSPAAATEAIANKAVYKSIVLGDGPLGYWRLDETTGLVAADSSGNGHNGALSAAGITKGQASLLAGDPVDPSMAFDGALGTMISTGWTVPIPSGSPFSLEAWVIYTDPSTAHGNIVVVGFPTAVPTNETCIGLSTVTLIPFFRFGGGLNIFVPAITRGSIHHLVATYDGSNGLLYLDGVPGIGGSSAPSGTPGNGLIISFTTTNLAYWTGQLDEVAIYGYALTPQQIQNHYLAGAVALGSTAKCAEVGVWTAKAADALGTSADYANTILMDGPSAYFRLAELVGASVAVDASGNGLNAAISGGIALRQPSPIAGDSADRSATFNGTSLAVGTSKIVLPLNSLEVTGLPFSVECWINPTAVMSSSPNTWSWIASREAASGQREGWGLVLSPGNGLSFEQWHLGAGTSAGFAANLAIGVWHHVVGTNDGLGVSKIYMDGVLKATQNASLLFTAVSVTPTIGVKSSLSSFVPATLDEVAFYPYVLSQAQVTKHYQVGAGSLYAVGAIATAKDQAA
jgi:hypothetical protein